MVNQNHSYLVAALLIVSPFLGVSHGQEVEIQINALVADADADILDDDYLTWAPTFCRARLIGSADDMTVVLSNDQPAYYLFVDGVLEAGDKFTCKVDGAELTINAGSTSPSAIATQIANEWAASTSPEFQRFDVTTDDTAVVITAKQANDTSDVTLETKESNNAESDGQTFLKTTKGDVAFADHDDPWDPNETARDETVKLELEQDGSWKPFVVAGRFGRPSTNDKDAVIVAHKDTATGDTVGEKKLMVRVRKNANRMGASERDRFLFAMRDFRNRPTNGFLMFQELHRLASSAGDEAHHQPAFYPWHRAFLLHVERELQSIDSSVTLPYWDWDEAAPNVFSQEFIGAPGTVPPFDVPRFAPGHPLTGWPTDLPFSGGALQRNTNDHAAAPLNGVFRPLDDQLNPDLIQFPDFSQANVAISNPEFESDSFSVAAEYLAHDNAHGWPCGGGHLTSPMRSSCDPLFYLLHSQVDRQWAYWQWKQDRFGVDMGGVLTFPDPPKHYDNEKQFDTSGNMPPPDADFRQKGSYLEDGFWPWDGTTGGMPATIPERPVNQAPTHDSGLAQAATNVDANGDGLPDFGTITLRSGASSSNEFYTSFEVRITNGDGADQQRFIFAYFGGPKIARVFPFWDTVPNTTSEYVIVDSNNVPLTQPTVSNLPFPKSNIDNLWPTGAVVPAVRHMIDYLGRFTPSDGLGFCYEDVPYETP